MIIGWLSIYYNTSYDDNAKACAYAKVVSIELLGQVSIHTGIINYWYSIAQMCIQENMLARLFMGAVLDDVMSQNELTTLRFWKNDNSLITAPIFKFNTILE